MPASSTVDPAALEYVRRRSSLFLPEGVFDGATIAARIVEEVRADGIAEVESGSWEDWCFVVAGRDWLENAPDVFRRILPHPMAGRNAFRWEIVLAAFATDVVSVDLTPERAHVEVVKGTYDDGLDALVERRSLDARLVAFRV